MLKRSEVRPTVQAGGPPKPTTITNAFWHGDKVVVLSRDQTGRLLKQERQAEYVCYIRDADLTPELRTKLKQLRYIRSMVQEGQWWRLTWADWKMLRKACEPDGFFEKLGLPTFEADLNPVRRYLTDVGPTIARPRRGYFDLETDSRVPIMETLKGKGRLLCWAVVRQDGTRVAATLEADSDEAEIELLKDFWVEIADLDCMVSWGDFDRDVIKERSLRLGIPVMAKRWLWLDHLELYRRSNMNVSESGDEKQSMALEAVAQALLGEGKTKLPSNRTWDYWLAGGQHREALLRYNARDADLLRRIEEKTGYIELHETVCEVCTTLPDWRGAKPTNFVEGYMLRLGKEQGVHFRTHYAREDRFEEKFEGAYVMEPTQLGIIENVHVADFASLYPSIIITFNLSPETLVSKGPSAAGLYQPAYLQGVVPKEQPTPPGCVTIPGTGAVFSLERQGILPMALATLMGLREHWKAKKNAEPPGTQAWKDADRRAGAYKITANSFYGVQGSTFSRFYERAVAESITLAGQWLAKLLISSAEERGFRGLYGDTDAVFVTEATREQFTVFVKWCNEVLWPRLLDERKIPKEWRRIKLSYEKAFRRLIMVAKKAYAGSYLHYEGKDATADSKPEIKGLEYKRGDTLKLAREFQHQTILQLLVDQELDPDVYAERVETWKERVLTGELALEEITLSKRMGMAPSEYKRKTKKDGQLTALPAHVALAERLIKEGKDFRAGDKVPYLVVDAASAPMQVIHPDEYKGKVDRYYLWENLVFPPTQRLLDVTFPAIKWKAHGKVRPGKRQISRFDVEGAQALLFGPVDV